MSVEGQKSIRMNAEVVGLEEQLTVPSRRHKHLMDIWIAVNWSGQGDGWRREFAAASVAGSGVSSAIASLEVVHLTPNRGWIVGREVDTRVMPASAVEACVCSLVADANLRVRDACAATETELEGIPFSARVRGTLSRLDMFAHDRAISQAGGHAVEMRPQD